MSTYTNNELKKRVAAIAAKADASRARRVEYYEKQAKSCPKDRLDARAVRQELARKEACERIASIRSAREAASIVTVAIERKVESDKRRTAQVKRTAQDSVRLQRLDRSEERRSAREAKKIAAHTKFVNREWSRLQRTMTKTWKDLAIDWTCPIATDESSQYAAITTCYKLLVNAYANIANSHVPIAASNANAQTLVNLWRGRKQFKPVVEVF